MCCEEKRQSGLFPAILIAPFLRASIGLHRHSERFGDRQAGDGHSLASRRFSLVLAMEVSLSGWQTEGPARNSSIDPEYEPRQPVLGCSPDPWRTPQARHRCGSNLGRQIYDKTQETPVARVEDFSVQPRRRDCLDGSLCRTDLFLSASLAC
jgi:hypothetical protein